MKVVEVSLAGRSYPVLIGSGIVNELSSLIPESAKRVAIVTQDSIPLEVDPGRESRVFSVPEGESAKTLSTIEALCSDFAAWGMTRSDAVVSVGGGVVSDVGGFAASVYHRGISVTHVPTTLLGQIDAAIGGKTGVNLTVGKNLVGSFWQPTAVICDVDTLASLPEREMKSGMGEMAKYSFLGAPDLTQMSLVEQVSACVQIKADVVSVDEREGGSRAILNYGHTLAHALEIAGEFDLRHGEAVAIGLMFAALLAEKLGRIDSAEVVKHRHVLDSYGLVSNLPARSEAHVLVELMGRDKKAIDGLTFILGSRRGVETVSGVAEDPVLSVLEEMEREKS